MLKTILISISFVFSAVSAYSRIYYVSPSGNDAGNGMTEAAAFLTLQHASDVALPGDSILILGGKYKGFDMRHGGSDSKPITFKGLRAMPEITSPCRTNDGINIEDADWIVLDSFTVNKMPRNAFRLVNANNCTVRNCSCDSNGTRGIFTGFTDDILVENNSCSRSGTEHGIYISNSSDRPVIRYNRCFLNAGCGIHLNGDASMGGDGIISDAQIYGNKIYENGVRGGSGINCDGVQNALIYNNLLYNNHATGIALFDIDAAEPSINAKVYNNTLINAANARWCVLVVNGSTGAEFLNNIIINLNPGKGSFGLDAASAVNFRSDYNILTDRLGTNGDDVGSVISLDNWKKLGYDAHSTIAPALNTVFTNPANNDYHLLLTSPALNKGTNSVSAVVKTDIDGNSRPMGSAYDIGCYEFIESGGGFLESPTRNQSGRIYIGKDYIFIKSLKITESVNLFDLTGNLVFSSPKKFSEDLKLNTIGLPCGFYFLIITDIENKSKEFFQMIID